PADVHGRHAERPRPGQFDREVAGARRDLQHLGAVGQGAGELGGLPPPLVDLARGAAKPGVRGRPSPPGGTSPGILSTRMDHGRPLEFGISVVPTAEALGPTRALVRVADRAGLDLVGIQRRTAAAAPSAPPTSWNITA